MIQRSVVSHRIAVTRVFGVALAFVFSAGISWSMSGCTLALDNPGTLTEQCRFKGSDTTTCGICVRDHCVDALAACCGDLNCQATLDSLDQCAGKSDQAACAKLRQALTLGSCVTSACKDVCLGEGSGSCLGSTSSCSCDDLAPSDASKCSEMSVGGGSCCADFGWPGAGLSCNCQAFRCKETADGCTCNGGNGPNPTCSGPHCCISAGECRCSQTACLSYESAVADCSSARIGCLDKARVSSCSESVH